MFPGSLCTVSSVCDRVWLRANVPETSVCVSWSTHPTLTLTHTHLCSHMRTYTRGTHMAHTETHTYAHVRTHTGADVQLHKCAHPEAHTTHRLT